MDPKEMNRRSGSTSEFHGWPSNGRRGEFKVLRARLRLVKTCRVKVDFARREDKRNEKNRDRRSSAEYKQRP